jgi:high affinity Mn2+ porin
MEGKMFKKVVGSMFLVVSLMSPQFVFALHPELVIPDKAEVKHKACQEMMKLGNKYKVEGVFSEDFLAGKVCYSRVEVASSLVLLTEKLAEKVVAEGPAAVDKEDLMLISELQEELRAEMLLANTRAFQKRSEELGTRFQALTKNISLSGGLVGVVQGSINNEPKNHTDVVGRGDLIFNFKVGENTIAVIDVEATGGDGIDSKIGNFSALNGVAGSTGDTVRFREAWLEHAAFNDRLIMTAGKIDLTNYFDSNAVANDELGQFLAGGFVNSAVLGASDIGPGVRVQAQLAEPLVFGIGYGSGDTDTSDILDHGFGIAELGYTLKRGGLEGNYRVYGTIDGALPDDEIKLVKKNALGFGFSLDQQLTDKLTLFARYGQRNKDVYLTHRAWSAGGQYAGLIPSRKDDVLAFAFGQISAVGASSQEKLAELYYKVQLTEQISITPAAQYLINPLGDRDQKNVVTLGLRTQILF